MDHSNVLPNGYTKEVAARKEGNQAGSIFNGWYFPHSLESHLVGFPGRTEKIYLCCWLIVPWKMHAQCQMLPDKLDPHCQQREPMSKWRMCRWIDMRGKDVGNKVWCWKYMLESCQYSSISIRLSNNGESQCLASSSKHAWTTSTMCRHQTCKLLVANPSIFPFN